MPFDYDTNLDAVVQALKDYNSAGSNVPLSGNLSLSISNDNILATDPRLVETRADRMPAIYVMIASKDESASTIGLTGPGSNRVHKEAIVEYEIFGVYGKQGGWSPHSELLEDVYIMAKNIEGVFQDNPKLSNTALWCHAEHTEFSPAIDLGEDKAKAFLIRLRAKYQFK